MANAVAPAVDLAAVHAMARVHRALGDTRGAEHPARRGVTLVRLAVCLFAQDTGVFSANAFTRLVRAGTAEDGAGLGAALAALFTRIGDPERSREDGFAHVAGGLFSDVGPAAVFGPDLRDSLLQACEIDWGQLSPAIFGSLLQRVMDDRDRHDVGAHYTSEQNIIRVLGPLFLDDLQRELSRCGDSPRLLRRLHVRIAALKLLDPSCGCGNFLVVAYRELRKLEQNILERLIAPGQQVLDLALHTRVGLEQCYGIELQGFAAQVTRLSLWLVDHQMNLRAADTFGRYFTRQPLESTATIVRGNALSLDWAGVVPADDDTLVMGNPPYGGKKEQSPEQKADMAHLWHGVKGAGNLDLVTGWFHCVARYMKGTDARCAFVSTNSITQGEQAGVLWQHLRQQLGMHITFAHRTFPWRSEGPRSAHVHVVIVGLSHREPARRLLFEQGDDGATVTTRAAHINPYLFDAPDTFIHSRRQPLCDVPRIAYGSMMIDRPRGAGPEAGLLLDPVGREQLLSECPALSPFIRRIYGGDEYLNSIERYCLWFASPPDDLVTQSPRLAQRIEGVRAFRSGSSRPQTRRLAQTPWRFGEVRQPSTAYLLIPKVSSEARCYLPIGFVQPDIIASGSALVVAGATRYHFGILTSAMHDAWVRAVAGRMKSDLQYSSSIVYNNFPWPPTPNAEQRTIIEAAAGVVLEARARHDGTSPARLYNRGSMPELLRDAHRLLDAAVDRCYRPDGFGNHGQRMTLLFSRHAELSAARELTPTSAPGFPGHLQPSS